MLSLCPVCNGMQPLQTRCSKCGETMQDLGPDRYYFGPYSPYMDIDLLKRSDGWFDLEQGLCVHRATCGTCGSESRTAVPEIHG